MRVFSKLADVLGGNLVSEVKDIAMAYFPPDMSDAEKAKADLAMTKALHKREIRTIELINEAAKSLDKRISDQEGTARDLRAVPVLGHIILLLRGALRPIWGYVTLYIDYLWFFGGGEFDPRQEQALLMVNFLVLGFMFGERAIKNLEPVLLRLIGRSS